MRTVLVVFAAGKSSRFGGFPKAFCSLGKATNIENTICLAKRHYKKIYVVVNKETYASGITQGLDADVISIVTGQGDADSILKALKVIKNDAKPTDIVTSCWGDAVFLDDMPFVEMNNQIDVWSAQSPAMVGCCIDQMPYAWFDTVGSEIVFSHFKKREKSICNEGLHDQSIFAFRIEQMISYLACYKKHLGLDIYNEECYDASRGEMSLLDAFTFFYEHPNLKAAEYCLLSQNKVGAFNTQEELCDVIKKIDVKKAGDKIC